MKLNHDFNVSCHLADLFSLSLLSPKVLNGLAQLHHGGGSSSSSPTGNGFITKEMFGAQVPCGTTPVKTPGKTPAKARRDGESHDEGDDSCGITGCDSEIDCIIAFMRINIF